VEGDSTEIHQVLMNLCVNARDAMPNGGRLTVRAANLTLAEYNDVPRGVARGRYVQLSVGDSGTGIPSEILKRIFEPFFTTKAVDKGTGLGLSTVSTLVKRHKGFVNVQSEVGKGTEFHVFLPAAQASASVSATSQKTSFPSGNGELVLVVDDEQVVVELAKSTLENYGYKVITAPNGLEAVACFEANREAIKVLITDTDMPFMDGMSAIKAIQEINPQLPIVIASGAAHAPNAASPIDFEHVTVISKPYGVEQLLNGIASALNAQPLDYPCPPASLENLSL
jgi:two-component system cell cycle sensor histidine kinase/response regulator CckA